MSGGGSGGSSSDKKFNAGMLALSQEQQQWAGQLFNQYMHGVTYNPYEQGYVNEAGNFVAADQKVAAASKAAPTTSSYGTGAEESQSVAGGKKGYGSWSQRYDNRASESAISDGKITTADGTTRKLVTRGEFEGFNPDDVTSQMEYEQNVIEANQELLPGQTRFDKEALKFQTEQVGAARKLLPQITGLKERLIKSADKGINVGRRVNQAGTAVKREFGRSGEATNRILSSQGLSTDPSNSQYRKILSNRELEKAKAVSGARSLARDTGEELNFRRRFEVGNMAG